MKEARKTYVGAAVFFERLADDGWPEDAGFWEIDGCGPRPVHRAQARVREVSRRSPFQLAKSLLRNHYRRWLTSLGA